MEGLTAKQRGAIAAILSPGNPTLQRAAAASGVAENTLHRWMKTPAFAAALDQAQDEAVQAAIRQLTGLATPAIAVIAGVLADRNAPPTARLRAAQGVLDNLLRLKEHAEFAQRLAAVEAALGLKP